jgi:hypothetical protein
MTFLPAWLSVPLYQTGSWPATSFWDIKVPWGNMIAMHGDERQATKNPLKSRTGAGFVYFFALDKQVYGGAGATKQTAEIITIRHSTKIKSTSYQQSYQQSF